MCLAIPVRLNSILPDKMARVTLSGVSIEVPIALLDDVAVGDYVIVHVGYALARIDPDEAKRTLALMREGGVITPSRIEEIRDEVHEEYRDGRLAHVFAAEIAREAKRESGYRFMEFCGGHTHTISRFGIVDLLPPSVRMIHGPGCPVCVLPVGRIDVAIRLAQRPEVTLCTYGDLMRVPGSEEASLLKTKAAGADIRMVHSTLNAIRIAEAESSREVVFFAIGFETTTPPTALAVRLAATKKLKNFSVFCNHVLTPSAI